MDILAERLKQLRKKYKITQKRLALHIGISERNYQDYEYGKVIPAATVLISIADYFNVSLDYLTGRTNQLPNQAEINENIDNSNYTKYKSNNDNNSQNDINEEEQELVSNYRILDKYEKRIIKGRIAEMLYNKEIEKNSSKIEFSDELINMDFKDKVNK